MQLINGYKDGDNLTELLDRYDYYIFPIVNPDGTHLAPLSFTPR